MFRNARRRKIRKNSEELKNARGRVYYGMHFYPGICEYSPPDSRPFRVFLNEDTIRKMDPTFAGRPVYVHHPDDPISTNLDVVRGEADGWVIRSFYNEKDGKHWTQFIVVTDAGELAVRRGWKLSNCYEGKRFGQGGSWNGMNYNKEVLEAEYEHLAIVPEPRYEESIILTPQEFKQYNENKDLELKRLANSKETRKMGFKMFTRKQIKDVEQFKNALVLLPKSKREVTLGDLVSEADQAEKTKGKLLVNSKTLVKFENEKMTLGELMEAHSEALDEIEELKGKLKNRKSKNEDDDDDFENEDDEDDADEMENESDDEDDEDEDEDEKPKNKKAKNKKAKNKKAKNSRREPEVDDDEFDDFEGSVLENESDDEDDDEDDDSSNGRRPAKRRVSNSKRDADEDDDSDEDDDEVEETPRVRNSKGARRKATKLVKNSKKKKSDKEKADRLRNAHNRALDTDQRYGDGLDPLARGLAMFGSEPAKK